MLSSSQISCNKPAGFTVGTVTFGHRVVYPAANEKIICTH